MNLQNRASWKTHDQGASKLLAVHVDHSRNAMDLFNLLFSRLARPIFNFSQMGHMGQGGFGGRDQFVHDCDVDLRFVV